MDDLASPPQPHVAQAPLLGAAVTYRRRRARTVYLVASIALIAVYPVAPAWARHSLFEAVALASIPALLAGMLVIRRDRRGFWLLLLTALVLVNLANIVRLVNGATALSAGILEAAGNVLFFLAALQLVNQQRHSNLGTVIDMSIAALAIGGLLWDVVLVPHLVPPYDAGPAKAAVFVGIFALTGVLGAVVQMIINRPVDALWPLVAAVLLALTADTLEAVASSPQLVVLTSMTFMAAYTAVGYFGLHPAAWQVVEPVPSQPDRLTGGRLVFLGMAVAAVPVDIGIKLLTGGSRDGILLLVSSVATAALVMLRVGQLSAQRDRAEEALRREASHDPLTGLVNRKEFTAQLGHELTARHHTAILFCDLDLFKTINDQYGHAEGDRVLIEVAQRLDHSIRRDDLAGRLGGDEFVVLLRNTAAKEIRAINHRIADEMARPFRILDQPMRIGITIGSAFAATYDTDPDELIKRADHAMYVAKKKNAERADTDRSTVDV